MPEVFQHDFSSYESTSTLAELAKRAQMDAHRFDRKRNSGPSALPGHVNSFNSPPHSSGDAASQTLMKAMLASQQQLKEAQLQVNLLAARLGLDSSQSSSGPPKSRNRVHVSPKRRMDQSLGPPFPSAVWCANHGWGSHTIAQCKLNGQQSPQQSISQEYTCVRNADGTYSPSPVSKGMMASQTIANLRALLAGQADIDNSIYIDTAADFSCANQLDGLTEIRKLSATDQVLIEGVGSDASPIRMTHIGVRKLSIDGNQFREPVYFSPDISFNLASTDQLASVGLSIYVDAESANRQLYLIPNNTKRMVPCERVHNIWKIPQSMVASAFPAKLRSSSARNADLRSSSMDSTVSRSLSQPALVDSPLSDMSTITEETEIPDTSRAFHVTADGTDPAGVTNPTFAMNESATLPHSASQEVHSLAPTPVLSDEPATFLQSASQGVATSASPGVATPPAISNVIPVDYTFFRSQLGNPSHERCLKVAHSMNVKLTNIRSGIQSMTDDMKIANQACRPVRPIEGRALRSNDDVTIVSDTIGANFPTSARGNRYLQTWTLRHNPFASYATVATDHTAKSSWTGFETFTKEAGLKVHRHMVNSGIVIATDNGVEYTGRDFTIPCNEAGIKLVTNTAHKSCSGLSGIAENANARLQQRMRASIKLAEDNFQAFGTDAELYWDYCAKYSAQQNRAISAALNGTIDYKPLCRTLPTAWGNRGMVTIQPTAPARLQQHKQLADRAEPGLLLNSQDGKYHMLLSNGQVVITSDVCFTREMTKPSHLIESLQDTTGKLFNVGDKVSITWPMVKTAWDAQVLGINSRAGTYSVFYESDQSVFTHLIDQIPQQSVRVLAARRQAPSQSSLAFPHPSVAEFITDTGDIRADLLTGEISPAALGIVGTLPQYTPANAPQCPLTVRQALSSPDAVNWLLAIIEEISNHYTPTKRI